MQSTRRLTAVNGVDKKTDSSQWSRQEDDSSQWSRQEDWKQSMESTRRLKAVNGVDKKTESSQRTHRGRTEWTYGKVILPLRYHLAGLVVKASTSGAEDPGFDSRLRRDFSGSSHTSDFKIGTPVAILPGAWHKRVRAGTGQPGVSILWLGEVESLICNFYLSVAARKIVCADPSLRYTSLLLGR